MKFLVLIIVGLLLNLEVLAHDGGLNQKGCHNNRMIGDYHCHRGPNISLRRYSPSKQETSVEAEILAVPPGAAIMFTVVLNLQPLSSSNRML